MTAIIRIVLMFEPTVLPAEDPKKPAPTTALPAKVTAPACDARKAPAAAIKGNTIFLSPNLEPYFRGLIISPATTVTSEVLVGVVETLSLNFRLLQPLVSIGADPPRSKSTTVKPVGRLAASRA